VRNVRVVVAASICFVLGCQQANTMAPLKDGFYLAADSGTSIKVMRVQNGQQQTLSGTFERLDITNARSHFRVTTAECGVIDFVLKPGDEVECPTCPEGSQHQAGEACPFKDVVLPRRWEYLARF
jgi:hypothetical protein